MAEEGQPLTPGELTKAYGRLNADYHGPHMEEEDTIGWEWMRIPHFYNAFYVYKYATGLSAAVTIVKNLGKPGYLEKYKDFLRSGGSDDPLELLRKAEVDIPTAVEDCMQEFHRAVKEFRALMLGEE